MQKNEIWIEVLIFSYQWKFRKIILIIECLRNSRLEKMKNRNCLEITTIKKGRIINRSYTCWNCYWLQIRAFTKRKMSNWCDICRNLVAGEVMFRWKAKNLFKIFSKKNFIYRCRVQIVGFNINWLYIRTMNKCKITEWCDASWTRDFS